MLSPAMIPINVFDNHAGKLTLIILDVPDVLLIAVNVFVTLVRGMNPNARRVFSALTMMNVLLTVRIMTLKIQGNVVPIVSVTRDLLRVTEVNKFFLIAQQCLLQTYKHS